VDRVIGFLLLALIRHLGTVPSRLHPTGAIVLIFFWVVLRSLSLAVVTILLLILGDLVYLEEKNPLRDELWRLVGAILPAAMSNLQQLDPITVAAGGGMVHSTSSSSAMRLRLKRYDDSGLVSGFGFGLEIQDRGSPPVLQIAGLARDFDAEKSGLVRPGDIILRINNVDVSRCTFDEALQTLASTPVGSFASFIVRAPYGFTTRLVTTFEEDGTPRTIRVTERTARKLSASGPALLMPNYLNTSSKMVNSDSNPCVTCQKCPVPNGTIPNATTLTTTTTLQPIPPLASSQRRK
jgi:hypothetical protein